MFKRTLIFLILLLSHYFSFGQGEANNWYFGINAGLSFNTGDSPSPLLDGQLHSSRSATISDPNGNLLFYTDGNTVWNRNHQIMQDGTDLFSLFTGIGIRSIIVPQPQSTTIYYVFTTSTGGFMEYSIVDMSLNNGLGAVISKQNNLIENISGPLTAIVQKNGSDIWLVTHSYDPTPNSPDGNLFYFFRITPTGLITTPMVQRIGAPLDVFSYSFGEMKFSPDGTKLAITYPVLPEGLTNGAIPRIFLYEFDPELGVLSNPIDFMIPTPNDFSIESYPDNVEFSPNNRYLYVNDRKGSFYQFDVCIHDANQIINSRTKLESITSRRLGSGAGMQLAPNGKIYISNDYTDTNETIGEISFPNNEASLVNYIHHSVDLNGRMSFYQFPNFIRSFFFRDIHAANFCAGLPTYFDLNNCNPDSIFWDFGDGTTSTEVSPDKIYTDPGTYTVTVTETINGLSNTYTTDVTIYPSPIANTITTYTVDASMANNGTYEFDLSTKDAEILGNQDPNLFDISYHLTEDDAIINANPLPSLYTNTANPQTIYARIQGNQNSTCYGITSFELEIPSLANIGTVSDFSICSLTPNTATFDLDSKNDEALDGQNPADFNISYHLSQDDADTNVNPLTSPYPYTDTSMPLPIFARLEAVSDPTQFDTTSFNLIVSQAPTVTTPNDIIVCDDNTNDGVESFDFTTTISDILNGQDPNVFSVTLFASQNDLDNNATPLPTVYQNTQPQQQIFAKIENTSNPNCIEQTSFMIGVSYSPFSVNPQDIIVCKDPTVNNTVTIDLSDYVLEILGAQNPADFTVTYHANENDADADQNPLPDAFSTTNTREQIVYRIENNLNTDCYINATLTLIVNNSPTIGTLTDVILCDDNNDGTVTFDLSSKDSEALDGQDPTVYQVLYFASQTDLDNNANALPSDYQNTQAQEQIFVRIHPINDVDCFNQSSFILTVSPTPVIASTPLALDNCGTIGVATFNLTENDDDILGNQAATAVTITYHTSSDDAMNNTNAITTPENYTSQQDGEEIFIRIESNTNTTCFATDSFILNVFEIPTAGTVTDLELCDTNADVINYDLSFSFPEILGTQDTALFDISFYTSQADADTRTNELNLNQETSESTTTVFARIENIGNSICYQTTSFNILKRESPVLTIADEVFICPEETLTLTADAGYDSYEWSTGETTERIDITTPGEYSVTVTANYNTVNCTTTKTFMVTASVVPQTIDVIVVDFKPGSQNTIKIITEGDGDFEYSIDGSSFQESNVFTDVKPGDYTAFVRDKGQCIILSKEFYVLGYPQFFTPNGDGFNEVWQILNPDKEPTNNIYIFDRYGKLLIRFTQGDIGWDGTFNGKQMPATDYWFKVERTNGQTIKGHFTLKR
ncbi:T9SS type B sorting domain-containing protein [Aquimarina rhabdastrellae]